MIALAFLASISDDIDTLGTAVAKCDRPVVNATFSAEVGRRSDFMRQTFREQEAIVAARRDLAQRRLALRSNGGAQAPGLAVLDNEGAIIEDRQRALNDQRLLENLRQESMDQLRRLFLQNCAPGKN